MITDKHGLLGQVQPDGTVEGGDTINWMGHKLYYEKVHIPYREGIVWTPKNIVDEFEKGFGGYVRHFDPDQTYFGFGAYYEGPYKGCMSRDQLTGLIGMMVKRKLYLPLLRVILNHACRGFLFAYNTRTNGTETPDWKTPDFTGPDIWAMMLRGFGPLSWLFYPLLLILDLHLLFNVLISNNKNNNDVISLVMKLRVSTEFVPTLISKLTYSLLDKDLIDRKLDMYWCGWRNQPEMYALMRFERY